MNPDWSRYPWLRRYQDCRFGSTPTMSYTRGLPCVIKNKSNSFRIPCIAFFFGIQTCYCRNAAAVTSALTFSWLCNEIISKFKLLSIVAYTRPEKGKKARREKTLHVPKFPALACTEQCANFLLSVTISSALPTLKFYREWSKANTD